MAEPTPHPPIKSKYVLNLGLPPIPPLARSTEVQTSLLKRGYIQSEDAPKPKKWNWTEEDNNELVDPPGTIKELARSMDGRTYAAVRKQRSNLGLAKPRARPPTEEEEEA